MYTRLQFRIVEINPEAPMVRNDLGDLLQPTFGTWQVGNFQY